MNGKKYLLPLLFSLLTGCFFPIVNFNPENPVDLGLTFRFLLLGFAVWLCAELGKAEPALFPGWGMSQLALLNLALGCGGLVFRFVLEFGEVSNTYNFTLANVGFHLLFVVFFTTLFPVSKAS